VADGSHRHAHCNVRVMGSGGLCSGSTTLRFARSQSLRAQREIWVLRRWNRRRSLLRLGDVSFLITSSNKAAMVSNVFDLSAVVDFGVGMLLHKESSTCRYPLSPSHDNLCTQRVPRTWKKNRQPFAGLSCRHRGDTRGRASSQRYVRSTIAKRIGIQVRHSKGQTR
jgi:hypothetical protein